MAPTVNGSLGPMLVSSRDADPSIACPLEVNSIDVPTMLRDSVDASGEQHKAVALCVGVQPDHWVRVLKSERGLPLDRLGKLPELVQKELVKRWATRLRMRVCDENARRDKLARLLVAAAEAMEEIA